MNLKSKTMKTKEQKVPKWFQGQIYDEGLIVENQFSEEEYELNNVELSIYDFIIGSQYILEMAPNTVTQKQVADFQKALTWFRVNNTEAYMVLLD